MLEQFLFINLGMYLLYSSMHLLSFYSFKHDYKYLWFGIGWLNLDLMTPGHGSSAARQSPFGEDLLNVETNFASFWMRQSMGL